MSRKWFALKWRTGSRKLRLSRRPSSGAHDLLLFRRTSRLRFEGMRSFAANPKGQGKMGVLQVARPSVLVPGAALRPTARRGCLVLPPSCWGSYLVTLAGATSRPSDNTEKIRGNCEKRRARCGLLVRAKHCDAGPQASASAMQGQLSRAPALGGASMAKRQII